MQSACTTEEGTAAKVKPGISTRASRGRFSALSDKNNAAEQDDTASAYLRQTLAPTGPRARLLGRCSETNPPIASTHQWPHGLLRGWAQRHVHSEGESYFKILKSVFRKYKRAHSSCQGAGGKRSANRRNFTKMLRSDQAGDAGVPGTSPVRSDRGAGWCYSPIRSRSANQVIASTSSGERSAAPPGKLGAGTRAIVLNPSAWPWMARAINCPA